MKYCALFLSFTLFSACTSKSQVSGFKEQFALDKKHDEVSGMVFHTATQKLWMLQDRGNPAQLYVYSPDGDFERSLEVNEHKNTDWEDLAQDVSGNLYIGDFGNNDNDRQDLKILKVNHTDLANKTVDVNQVTTFYYEDQERFPPKKSDFMYDCEAFVVINEYFYLFTKNRSKGFNGDFYVYRIPNQQGHFKAEKIATINSCKQYKSCAITGAAYDYINRQIALITHDKVLLFPYENDASFSNVNFEVKELEHHSQKESLTFINSDKLYIADEKDKKRGGKVYVLELE